MVISKTTISINDFYWILLSAMYSYILFKANFKVFNTYVPLNITLTPKGFSYYKNHYAKVTIISSQNKSFLAHNWILLTSPTARYKIILLYFTTFSSNKNLFLSALRASRNKFNYDSCKTFILAFDYYHHRISNYYSFLTYLLEV